MPDLTFEDFMKSTIVSSDGFIQVDIPPNPSGVRVYLTLIPDTTPTDEVLTLAWEQLEQSILIPQHEEVV